MKFKIKIVNDDGDVIDKSKHEDVQAAIDYLQKYRSSNSTERTSYDRFVYSGQIWTRNEMVLVTLDNIMYNPTFHLRKLISIRSDLPLPILCAGEDGSGAYRWRYIKKVQS